MYTTVHLKYIDIYIFLFNNQALNYVKVTIKDNYNVTKDFK